MRALVKLLGWLVLIVAPWAQGAGVILLPNGSSIYNTGIDTALDGGKQVDQRYLMTQNPFAPGSTRAWINGAGYLSSHAPPNDDSLWITPSGTGTHAPESAYHIATEIDLTGLDPSSLVISGFWTSDNGGLDILVNGNSTGQTNPGFHSFQPSELEGNAFSLSGADGLIAGVNTVTFVWGNGPAGGAGSQFPNPTHVRIEFSEVAVVPLPAAVFLVLPALAILVRRRRT